MGNDKEFIELRDELRNSADIIDELLALEEKEAAGENIEKESEAILGRFLISMIKIQKIANKM